MRLAAWKYAHGGQQSEHVKLAYLLERFGAAAILDRPLRGREMMSILHTERIVRAVEARSRAKSVIEWECQNETDAEMLEAIEALTPALSQSERE